MSATSPATASLDRDRIASLTAQQRELLRERTRRSGEHFERARAVMPAGVPSQFQRNDPWPVYLDRGQGARVWDVDGNEYLDFHNGFGVMCVGHANPVVAAAVKARMDDGTHFAAPTTGSIVVAEELRRRWGLPHWRFTNSGTESTMDGIHLARGSTGRDVIVKIEGTYHGHHDAVMVSVKPPAGQMGDRGRPASVPYGLGYPAAMTRLTRAVPFNDADALAGLLAELDGEVAGVIMEPAMMNINIVPPVEGYLERVRELCTQHGAVLIFDEVKTGAAVAAGGATELFGVTPDVVCLAKAICGGLPGGAVGMTDALAEIVADGRVRQQGTFNGNPLTMAAAEATLCEVLTDAAYAQLHAANERLMAGCEDVIARYGLPAHTVGMGSKGCVVFSREPIREYRDYLTKIEHDLSDLAWLFHMNGGIFMTPGQDEEWTLSVLHTDADLQRYVDVFETFAREVTRA
ncbi:MAG: glutamate-semialdehyde -aminomutase [Baekduia sp.]|jgi:glutamate-1-semialdehyde 2,1-aminomutase|nr:glutamate-semialdehyde -aminomutase [Baekduia sp.]MEA2282357.1 glutamate-semialdehyde -aminomutase [Solirubrobacteraceae bacterium]